MNRGAQEVFRLCPHHRCYSTASTWSKWNDPGAAAVRKRCRRMEATICSKCLLVSQSVHGHLNVDVMRNGLQMIVVVLDRCFRHASGYLGNDKGFPYSFQGCARVFIHVDFTLQNRPLPFTEKWEKGSGLRLPSENQDFNFFGKKLATTKEKALNPLRFKAFGAARQIRIDANASRIRKSTVREAVFLLFSRGFYFSAISFFEPPNVDNIKLLRRNKRLISAQIHQ